MPRQDPKDPVLATNRKAFHDYNVLERFEAGIQLLGTEVTHKSGFARLFEPSTSLRILVGSNGLGPSTSRLSGVCSNQLMQENARRMADRSR